MPTSRTDRKWPPLAAAGVGFVLVFLILPNPLATPQNNPTASAEYAPVPGRQQKADDANFSETELASSAGIGSGGTGEGLLPGTPPPPPLVPTQFKPRQKACVGDPPRQTEDPLSPPCVPFWEGENGGETWAGVSKDEVRIAFYNDSCIHGTDLVRPYRPSDECGDQNFYEHKDIVRTVKAQLRYFQSRYQTYGRTVRMWGYKSGGGPATQPEQRRGEASGVYIEHKPFGTAALVENAQDFYHELATVYKIPSFGWNEDVPADLYEETAPYVWSFGPDQETETEYSAAFICRKLFMDGKGRAKFTEDPDLVGKPRKFALLWPTDSQRGEFHKQLATKLNDALERQCNLKVGEYPFFGDGHGEAPTITRRMIADEITTVICYCVPVLTETTVTAFQNAATTNDWFPEWYWDHASAMDRAVWQQTYGSDQHTSLGVSYLWRQPAFEESYAYQAYLEKQPNTVPNVRFNFEIYHIFLNLFSAIQGAGPNLTPESVKRGMFTFRYQDPENPWLPTGSYGTLDGPSPYTFLDTAMAWWYDADGTPPGGVDREGCNRVLYNGRRFYGSSRVYRHMERARAWPKGDDDIVDEKWPCTEDTRKIDDPASAQRT